MGLQEFIQNHVNTQRGGYRPEEVARLIQMAWNRGRQERQEEIARGLGHLADEREDDLRQQ